MRLEAERRVGHMYGLVKSRRGRSLELLAKMMEL